MRAPDVTGATPGPGRPAGRRGRSSGLHGGQALPAVLVLAGAVSVQSGAGIAARLFSQLPPASLTTLRLWSAALIMLIVGGRAPPARSPAWPPGARGPTLPSRSRSESPWAS